jgi:uncharacterized membrane protein
VKPNDERLVRLEQHLGRLLISGVALSAVALILGIGFYVVNPASAAGADLLAAGLIILMATPMFRVVVSIVEYIRMGDWFFVLVTLAVLAELAMTVTYALRR